MKIEDLAEFEGLTADIVRAWLRAKGWEPPKMADSRAWEDPTNKAWVAVYEGSDLTHTLDALAYHYQRSMQALLNEINPRMRAGWPTDDELERHAFWLIGQPAIRVDLRVTTAAYVRAWRDRSDSEFTDNKVECWPCDQHGNKVRRGA